MARRLGILAVMLVAIWLLAWAGVRNLAARRAAMEAPHVELVPAASGSPDAAAPDAAGAGLMGRPAPGFTLVDTSGKKVSLSDFKGRPVVVNFWATWCGPCKLEMPWFQEFAAKYQPQGLVILGLAQDDGAAPSDIASAAKRIGVSYPVLMPDDKVTKLYGGVDYLPETFYVSRAGKVLAVGAGAPSKEEMEARIKETIAAAGA